MQNKNKIFIIIIALVILALIIGGIFYFRSKNSLQIEPTVIDDLPIWILEDGNTAVYREVNIGENQLEKNIVLVNLQDQELVETEIYEAIPKELAASVTDLQFSIEPKIIEDDPIVLWSTCKSGKVCKEPGLLEMTQNLAAALFTITRDVGLTYFSDVCSTKTAKAWIKGAGYKEGTFAGCSYYIKYLERDIQERTSKDWQNKSVNSKIAQNLEPGTSQYQQIQSKAKKAIPSQQTSTSSKTPTKTTPTGKDCAALCQQVQCKNCRSGYMYCNQQGNGCVECYSDSDCPSGRYCGNNACWENKWKDYK